MDGIASVVKRRAGPLTQLLTWHCLLMVLMHALLSYDHSAVVGRAIGGKRFRVEIS